MARFFLILGSILALIPVLPLVIGLVTDYALDESSREAVYGTSLKWVLIFRHIGAMPLFLGAVVVWLGNWNNGYASLGPWICLVLGSLCALFGGPLGIIVGPLVLILAMTAETLAFWK